MKELDKYGASVLTMMQMKDCRPSTSPKLEKQTEPGDDDPCEHPELYRSAVCTILYMTNRRPDFAGYDEMDVQEAHESQQKVLESIGQNCEVHQGVERFGYVQAEAGKPDIIEAFFMETGLAMIWTGSQHLVDIDGWWLPNAQPQKGRLDNHALSSGESEIMSMSEVLKEAKLMQYNLEFCGMGLFPIVLHTDADVASPSAEELRKFLPMIGCHTMTVNSENYNAVKTMLKSMLTAKVAAFLTSFADVVKS